MLDSPKSSKISLTPSEMKTKDVKLLKKKNNKKDYSPVLMKPCKKVLGNKTNN